MKPEPKLTIELVPSTSWCDNVRSRVSLSQWTFIRQKVFAKAEHRCEICGGVGKKHPVECHEVWVYDDEKHTQTLDRMISLCPSCHRVKHAGFAITNGYAEAVIAQLWKVNRMKRYDACMYIAEALDQHTERSKHQWEVNVDALKRYL